VWVLDIDRKNGKDGLRELIAYADAAGVDLPDTRTVRTPSGGLHLYFRWDESRPVGNRAGVLPGLDVRGKGGFVCAGGAYGTIGPDAPVCAPDWLFALVGQKEDVEVCESAVAITPEHPEWSFRLKTAAAFLAGSPPCISGQGGDTTLWSIALRLMRTYELPLATALSVLEPYNARCTPPWSPAELTHNLSRAASIGQGPTGMFPEGFVLGGDAPGAEGDPPGAEKSSVPWRKRGNSFATYGFDMAASVAGGSDKLVPYSAKELAALFTGPAAAPDWVGVWQFDLFRRRTVAVNPPLPLDAETIGLTESDKMRMQVWCNCIGVKASLESIGAAIVVAASCATFHPIKDYLDGLKEGHPPGTEKSSVESADAYFADIASRLWGCPEDRNELESGHVRRFAIAAVRRIRRPGTKVDTMLMLAGEQGFRKSSFAAHLFGEFFRDQIPNVQAQKEASIAIEGYWGIELAELAAFGKVDEPVKNEFISRSEDKYRPVWASGTLVLPRQCVFIGTTNQDDFLHDATGSTRYDVCEVLRPIDLGALNRDEFWSHACALESAGESHYRDRAVQGRLGDVRHAYEHPWTSVVRAYADARVEAGYVTAAQALTYGVPVAIDRQTDAHTTAVKGILRRAYGTSHVRCIDGRAQRVYLIPGKPAA
jgi:hypothetical protein